MDKCLKPARLEVEPSAPDAKRKWLHWVKTLLSYINSIDRITEQNKLNILINHVDATIYELISKIDTYAEAVATLHKIYVKPSNVIFARYLLSTCKQQPDQTVDEYLQVLKRLSKDGDYAAVTADQHRQ